MDYESAMRALREEGFLWRRLRDYFPFGATELGEGNYQRLLAACLERMSEVTERERLLDLLDMQAATFLEQCWVQDELDPKPRDEQANDWDDVGRFGFRAHVAAAWLQINSSFRHGQSLKDRSLGRLMLGLGASETLRQRMVGTVPHPEEDS